MAPMGRMGHNRENNFYACFRKMFSRTTEPGMEASGHSAESSLLKSGSLGPQEGIKFIFIGKIFKYGPT
jgi:hypothetical protein